MNRLHKENMRSVLTGARAMQGALKSVIEKYSDSPEFMEVEIAGPNQTGLSGDTLLHVTARLGAIEDMRVLLAAGGEVNAIGDIGNTPLHGAAMRGQADAVNLLLEHGADSKIKNEFGQTPLDVARISLEISSSDRYDKVVRYPVDNCKAVVGILESLGAA